jgi:hypothetical protein
LEIWQRQILVAGAYQASIGDEPDCGARFAEAKRLQIEAGGGAPLTVCVGRDRDGCGAVFADSTSTRGPMPFLFYCATCRGRSTRRRESNDARQRAYAAGLEELAPGVWWGLCRCGAEYASVDVRQRSCGGCRRGHR